MSRHAPPILLVALFVLSSCLQGARAPNVPATRTLAAGEEGPGTTSTKEFDVVYSAPHGETSDPSEVTIVFNRPMRPLELAGDESAPPAKIETVGGAPPKGRWQWMGTSALAFFPDPQLPRANEFVVTVPAGTRALDGSALAKEHAFHFTTPGPHVVRISPDLGTMDLVPTTSWELRFNQPVDPKQIERAVKIELGEGKAQKTIGVRASWPKGETKALLKVTPVQSLPLDTAVTLVIGKSLHGMEGPRTVGADDRRDYRTYGPLAVRSFECSKDTPHKKCAARGWLRVDLSNRVSYKEFQAHVRVDGAPKIAWNAFHDEEGRSSSFSVPARLGPARSYRLVVTAGMKDEHGQVLPQDASFPIDTDDEWPEVQVGLEGGIFEGKTGAHEIPVGSMNTGDYQVATATLDEPTLVRLLNGKKSWRGVEYDDVTALPNAKVDTIHPGGGKNQLVTRKIALDPLLAATHGRGAVAVGVRHEGRHGLIDARIVSVTDLAVSAKMSRFGSLVWVTRLSDGKPVGDATVTVRGEAGDTRWTGKTDAQGLATIDAKDYSPVEGTGSVEDKDVVFARLGDDFTYRRVSEMISPWRFGSDQAYIPTDISGELRPFGMLFTDRGVYRPGETVRAKAIFRAPLAKGTETPRGKEYVLEAYDSSETKIFETRGTLGAFGELAVDVKVPPSARLGMLELRAELGNTGTSARNGVASAGVLLAAYKASEFKVSVEPEKPAYVRGDKAGFSVHGDYLFGAPMSSGKVHFTATRGSGYFALPGAEGFVYGDESYAYGLVETGMRAGQFQAGDGALDAKGLFGGALALTLPNQRGTEVVTFEAEVQDISRQTIAASASAIVHPGEFYVAMRPPKDLFVAKGTTLKPEVLAIEPSGKKRTGVKIAVDLLKRSWSTVVEATGDTSSRYDSRPKDTKVGGCEVTSDAQARACDLPPAEAGYYILRASAKDGRGNVVAASSEVYVLGEGNVGGWAVEQGSHLSLVPDKKSYEVGDTAKILVKSPFTAAEALVTVERHGVYETRRMTLSGGMPTLTVPITDALRPNVFVSVYLVRGRTKAAPAKGQDVGAPAYRLGYAELRVNPEARRLKVALTPSKKDLRPGEEIDCDVAVTDRNGKPARAEVTFYAVDEGVLMLTGYKTPDPIPVFTRPRPLAVFALETRDDLAKIRSFVGALGDDKGFEGGGGGASVREDFRATAYFTSVVAENGKAKVHFKLPDSTTTYRLMAVVAAEDDRFGFGESQVTTSRPLMARPAMPRFLRTGDAIQAGVVLTSKGMAASNVEVSLEVQGARLDGEAKKTVALPANGSVEVKWPISAPSAGKAVFAFHARAPGGADDVRVTREIATPTVPEAVALYGETTEASAEKLGDLRALRSDVGGLDVRVASTALVGLDDGVEQLVKYPYGCTEQLTSRLVPLLPLRDLAKDYGMKLPENTDDMIASTVGKILERQHGDGSFGWWPDSPRGDPWISGYALWGLTLAKKYGAHVPDPALASATRYVRRELDKAKDDGIGGATAAFLLDVLADAGSPDTGYANVWFGRREKLPLFAKALLAHAMVTSKMRVEDARELLRDFDNHLRVTPTGATVVENLGDAYAPLLDSEARTTAMALRAMIAVDPKHALAGRIAKGLLGARNHGTWRSTQETAWALLSLDDYRRAQEKTAPDFDARVFLGETMIFEQPFQGRSLAPKSESFAMDKLLSAGAGGSALAFQVKGSGKLFYEARLRYAKKELPKDGLDRGFFIRKVVRSVRPDGLKDALGTVPNASATSAAAGDLVLVDLIVVTPDPREHVVVEDPLPAGLEPVQAELATTARSLDVADAYGEGDASDWAQSDDDARSGGSAYTFAWYHREIHDDKVLTFVPHMPAGMFHYRYLARATTSGRFVVPPTRAECMYEPETFGRTGATGFEVK